MRLVVATDVTVRGGVDTYVLAYLDALRRQGHDAVLLYEKETASPVAGLAASRGVESIPLPLYRGWYERGEIEDACRTLLAATRPDGIHVVTGSPRSCLALRAQAIASGIPLVITESQVDQELLVSAAERAEIRASYDAALAVVFVAEGNRSTMANVVGIDSANTVLIPNGVDVSRLARYRRTILRPRVPARLVTVARLSPEKSLDILVAAVGLLPRDLVCGLDIHGNGPIRSELSQQIVRCGLADRVFLRGWTADVIPVLARSDLFILPSAAEGMPYALLEAMAVGLPVVCSDVPGNTEALAAGSAGCLVPRSNPRALADGIRDSLLDPGSTEARARAALSRVRSAHDRASLMDQTARLWTDRSPP